MDKYFLTGATGMLGEALIEELASRGETDLTALVLPKDPGIKRLPPFVKVKVGDITDESALLKALDEGMIVIHMAALVSIKGSDKEKLFHVNYEGTKAVVDAALAKHAKKFIYISTSHVLGGPKGQPLKEEGIQEPTPSIGAYEDSKKKATLYVLSKVQEGLDASIIYPVGIVGYPDPRLGEISTLVYKFANGKLRYYVKGGYAFVDVHDVAKGIYLASKKGQKGQGYTLSGGYLSIDQIHEVVRASYKGMKKGIIFPFFFTYLVLPFISLNEKVAHKKPLFTLVSLRTVKMKSDFDTSKAERELGLQFTPLETSINNLLSWLISAGLAPQRTLEIPTDKK
jgi:dihydroflavonol-4-reductase